MTTAAKISILLEAQTASLQKGFGDAKSAIKDLDSHMTRNVAGGMAMFQIGLTAITQGLELLRSGFRKVMETMESMGRMDETATRLGTTADALTVLGYAAEQTGSSQEHVNSALEKMQNKLGEAATGSKSAMEAFAALGLSAKDLAGQPTDKVFAAIAEQMQSVGSNTERTRLAIDIFGKSGGELINLLSSGAEGINTYGKEVENLGLLLGNARSAVEATGDAVNKMKRAWGGLWEQITILVAPAIAALSEVLTTAISGWNWLLGLGTEATAPFKEYASEAKKAAIHIEKTMKATEHSAHKAAEKIKEAWKDIPKPKDYEIPSIAAVTRGSAAGFSAVQEAQRKAADDRRWQDKMLIYQQQVIAAIKANKLSVSTVNI